MPDYRFRWNNPKHPACFLYWDTGVLTAGGQVKDLTYRGNNGTINGAPTYGAPATIRCKTTKSMNFDGAAVAIQTAASVLDSLTSASVVLFGKSSTIAATTAMMMYHSDAGAAARFDVRRDTNRMFQYSNITSLASTIKYFQANDLMMIVITMDGTTVKGYYNGKPAFVRADGTQFSDVVNGIMTIGAPRSLAGQFWAGTIDIVQVWNVILTQEQVVSIKRSSEPRA